MKMMKLNNKGFTLVELLAVVVILAVVMGIAANSVLSSMNNSRKGSLQNSAKSVSQAFQTKYSEAMVTQSLNNIYGDILGDGYNFVGASTENPVFYQLAKNLENELNLSSSTYKLVESGATTALTAAADGSYSISNSFIAFNGKTVVVCLFAEKNGNYYVTDFGGTNLSTTILDKTVKFGGTNEMWSCSQEGINSWTVGVTGTGSVVTSSDD